MRTDSATDLNVVTLSQQNIGSSRMDKNDDFNENKKYTYIPLFNEIKLSVHTEDYLHILNHPRVNLQELITLNDMDIDLKILILNIIL